MAKVVINIDDKMLDKTIKAEVKRLKKRIDSLEITNNKLRDKLQDQKSHVEAAKTVVEAARNIMDNFNNYECLMKDFENRWD